MKRQPHNITISLPPADKKRMDKIAKDQNTFPKRLAVAIVLNALSQIEAGMLTVETTPRIGS